MVYIWQLPVSNPRVFRPVDYDEVKLSDYVLVYHFDDDNLDLEDIYEKLNDAELIPADYHARSLSVGDLITIHGTDNEIRGYVVDIIGFTGVKVKNG